MTYRHLQRLRRAYREEGLIGLDDRRKLREITPGAETDPRVISAIEKMRAEPRGRSTVARSVMFTELQRRPARTRHAVSGYLRRAVRPLLSAGR